MARRALLEFTVGLTAGGAILAGLAAPKPSVSGVSGLGRDLSVSTGVPLPVIASVLVVLGLVVWLALMWLFARGAGEVWVRVGGHVTRAVGLVLPESVLWRFTTGLILLLVLVLVIIGLLPAAIGP
jgi:hypothetical protein